MGDKEMPGTQRRQASEMPGTRHQGCRAKETKETGIYRTPRKGLSNPMLSSHQIISKDSILLGCALNE